MSDKVITWDELQKHTKRSDCWVAIDGQVFDVTSYFAEHPGGDDILMRYSGKDATKKFHDIGHSSYAESLRDLRKVGNLETNPPSAAYKKWEESFWTKNKVYQWTEVQKHNKPNDIWIVINDTVYDVTKYVQQHPGGSKVLLERAGKNVTQQFKAANHPNGALVTAEEYKIGTISKDSPAPIEKQETSVMAKILLILLGIFGAYIYTTYIKQE